MRTAQYGKAIHQHDYNNVPINMGGQQMAFQGTAIFLPPAPVKGKPPSPARLGGLQKINADGRPGR
jgi:hypothetical protein